MNIRTTLQTCAIVAISLPFGLLAWFVMKFVTSLISHSTSNYFAACTLTVLLIKRFGHATLDDEHLRTASKRAALLLLACVVLTVALFICLQAITNARILTLFLGSAFVFTFAYRLATEILLFGGRSALLAICLVLYALIAFLIKTYMQR